MFSKFASMGSGSSSHLTRRAASSLFRSGARECGAPALSVGLSGTCSRYASTLVVAEHQSGKLSEQTLATVTAAKKIGGDIAVLVAGSDAEEVGKEAAGVSGVSKVLCASDAAYDNALAENVTELVLSVQKNGFTHIMFAATNEGKSIAPRVCAKLDVSPISEVLEVLGEDTFKRPMYAGNAIATVKSKDSVKVVTVRTTSFENAEIGGDSATVESASGPGDSQKSKWIENLVSKSDRPDLTSAQTVIAGGRGMQNGDNFEMLYKLADKIPSAAVGASRAAVDAGFVPNELQIGQTGKVVAPSLYIGVGISGAIQHLAGMKDSKCIVSINKDPEAPIFQVSDHYLEADLFNAVPEIIEKI